jgi:aryl-alcohol dehydrogenase-like predicted oxidoreductase
VSTLTLGTSALARRGLDPRPIVAAAAATGFAAIDLSPAWGELDTFGGAALPAVVRIPPRGSWPLGRPTAVDEAYPRADVVSAVVRALNCGVVVERTVLHKWDPAWSGPRERAHLEALAEELPDGVGLGVACPDSEPAAGLAIASRLEAVSLQLNLANRLAEGAGPTYARQCRVEARAPFDAGSLLPGFLDGLGPTDVRRRVFEPFGAAVRVCSATLARVAEASGLAPPAVALRWVLRHDWISEVCVGAVSVAQVEALADGLAAGPLSDQVASELDGLDWSWRYKP